MSKLATLYSAFHSAILHKNAAQAAPSIKTSARLTPEQQLAIYIDGYRLRLIEAIRSDYPTLLYYLGDTEFDSLARRYIETTPPTHFNLDRYPHAFAAIAIRHEDEFAVDIAMLESAIAQVFMLEESESLSPETLAQMTPEALSVMALKPRAASRLLHLRYPADSYITDLREGKSPAKPEADALYLYLVRHHNEVKRHALTHAEFLLLEKLYPGTNLDNALESLCETYPELMPDFIQVLQTRFGTWVHDGFFTAAEH